MLCNWGKNVWLLTDALEKGGEEGEIQSDIDIKSTANIRRIGFHDEIHRIKEME